MNTEFLTKLAELTKIEQLKQVDELTLTCVGVAAVLFFFLLLVRVSRRAAPLPEQDRHSGLMGRLEKLEITLNELKTHSLRNAEISKGDIGYLKSELAEIRALLSGGGSSGGATGGGNSGSGRHGSGGLKAAPIEISDDVESTSTKNTALDEVLTSSAVAPEQPKVSSTSTPATLAERLVKSRSGFFQKLKSIFSKGDIQASSIEELEMLLVESDVGVKCSAVIIKELQDVVKKTGTLSQETLKDLLREKLVSILSASESEIDVSKRSDGPTVIMVVGVNGVGKTTTVAKLAARWKAAGKSVLVVAADTFRAAATDQLAIWAARLGVDVVTGPAQAKPASVVFDGMIKAKSGSYDVVIVDTAGRLHNKSNLMQELEGIKNAMVRHQITAPHETWLVVDGVTGQNALSQASEFNSAVKLSGVIVTKLDGSPKGGIVVAIKHELGIPVRFIGVGESSEDLRPFKAEEFVGALLDESGLVVDSPAASAHGEVRRRRRSDTMSI
jgi:fused signal recognition particle receptor